MYRPPPARIAFAAPHSMLSATASTEATCSTCVFSDSLWYLGHLPVGTTATLTVIARVTGTGQIINMAEIIESHLPDLDSANDQNSVMIDVPSGKATSIVGEGGQGSAFTVTGAGLNQRQTVGFSFPKG